MRGRRARTLAWGLCAVAILSAVGQLILWAARLNGPPTVDDAGQHLFWGLAFPVVFSILAAMIVARQPANRVGWLMMVVALATAPLGLALDLVLGQLSGPPAVLTTAQWLALWISGWSWIPVIFPIFLIPLFFPTGSPPTPRWRWVAWLAYGMWVAFLVLSALGADIQYADWTMVNPIGILPAGFWDGGFMAVWGAGLLTTLSGSIASLVVRYRRAGTGERQQIKWLLLAGAAFTIVYAVGLFASDAPTSARGWADLLFPISILAFPAAITIAIFRYRLWDLEVVVNRAVIYGLLTTLLAGIFAAVIAVITEAGKDLLGEGSRALGAAISALTVAVVFQPLRTWIEAWVNRRFYPEKNNLASGLVEVEPGYWGFLDRPTLFRLSTDHVRRVLGTPQAAFYVVSESDGFRLAAKAAGSVAASRSVAVSGKQRQELGKKRVVAAEGDGAMVAHVPVYVDRGSTSELLGLLSIGPRRNGRGYSGDDLKGLVELGGKIGLALNAIRLRSARR
ncbi:MAG TPA: hypothetical protein VLD63_10205 [Anaerolineales bacterium]|nr:hypothetical protein [Anaerolineales bacterium]